MRLSFIRDNRRHYGFDAGLIESMNQSRAFAAVGLFQQTDVISVEDEHSHAFWRREVSDAEPHGIRG